MIVAPGLVLAQQALDGLGTEETGAPDRAGRARLAQERAKLTAASRVSLLGVGVSKLAGLDITIRQAAHPLSNLNLDKSGFLRSVATQGRLARGVACGAIVALGVVLRLRFVDLPLSRDEGEYAYVAQLLLHGISPYAEAYTLRWPGIYVGYALIEAVFGQTHTAVHLGLIVLNALTVVAVYALARRLAGDVAALSAALAYVVLSLTANFNGFAAYTEHFVVALAVPGLVALHEALMSRRPAWAALGGTLLAGAMLMKQSGVVFLVFGLAWLLLATVEERRPWLAGIGACALGAAAPLVLTAGILVATGVFGRFWLWTMQYGTAYVRLDVPALSSSLLWGVQAAAPLYGLAGFAALSALWDLQSRRAVAVALPLFGAAALGSAAGFYFRPQYFLLLTPPVAVLAGVGAVAVTRPLRRNTARAAVAVALVAAGVASALWLQREFFFRMDPRLLARAAYEYNPFPEALEIGRWLRANSRPEDRIAILGSEPEIFFYARRRSATGHVYMYPLMEAQPYARAMQAEMIREIEAAAPTWLIVVWVKWSWLMRPESDVTVLRWAEPYVAQHFERVGVADIVAADRTEYRWGAEATGYTIRSPDRVEVFRRRTAASVR